MTREGETRAVPRSHGDVASQVGQRKGRIFQQFDVAGDKPRLARRALTLLAAVHERNALPECRFQNRLPLFDLHFEADRLQPNLIDFHVGHRPLIEFETKLFPAALLARLEGAALRRPLLALLG